MLGCKLQIHLVAKTPKEDAKTPYEEQGNHVGREQPKGTKAQILNGELS